MNTELLLSLQNLGALLFVLAGLCLLLRASFLCNRLLVLGVIAALLSGVESATFEVLAQWLNQLPAWLLCLIGGFSLLGLLGAFASLFIGRDAANSMVGDLAASLVRMLLKIVVLPMRGLRRMFWAHFGGD